MNILFIAHESRLGGANLSMLGFHEIFFLYLPDESIPFYRIRFSRHTIYDILSIIFHIINLVTGRFPFQIRNAKL